MRENYIYQNTVGKIEKNICVINFVISVDLITEAREGWGKQEFNL